MLEGKTLKRNPSAAGNYDSADSNLSSHQCPQMSVMGTEQMWSDLGSQGLHVNKVYLPL